MAFSLWGSPGLLADAQLSLHSTATPRKLPWVQGCATSSSLPPVNKTHDAMTDSDGETVTEPQCEKLTPWDVLPDVSRRLFYLFVPLKVPPSIYSGDDHRRHRAACCRCTWATRGGRSYATIASWQLLRCGKDTQFFHKGVSGCSHNNFERVTGGRGGIVLTEEHRRRIWSRCWAIASKSEETLAWSSIIIWEWL